MPEIPPNIPIQAALLVFAMRGKRISKHKREKKND